MPSEFSGKRPRAHFDALHAHLHGFILLCCLSAGIAWLQGISYSLLLQFGRVTGHSRLPCWHNNFAYTLHVHTHTYCCVVGGVRTWPGASDPDNRGLSRAGSPRVAGPLPRHLGERDIGRLCLFHSSLSSVCPVGGGRGGGGERGTPGGADLHGVHRGQHTGSVQVKGISPTPERDAIVHYPEQQGIHVLFTLACVQRVGWGVLCKGLVWNIDFTQSTFCYWTIDHTIGECSKPTLSLLQGISLYYYGSTVRPLHK